jgi:hypothetical protein
MERADAEAEKKEAIINQKLSMPKAILPNKSAIE